MWRVRRLELRQYKKKLKAQEPQVEPVPNLLDFFIKMNHKRTLTEQNGGSDMHEAGETDIENRS
jgi:hypothetical protein